MIGEFLSDMTMPRDHELARGERLQIMLSPEELKAVDDFRFKKRMPSRAAAVRELFRLGLSIAGSIGTVGGAKSSSYGVLGDGPQTDADESPRTRKK
jgi:hypothetical protein